MEETENKRPKLTDPAEWAIIRSIYFDTSTPEALDPEERSERLSRGNLKNHAR